MIVTIYIITAVICIIINVPYYVEKEVTNIGIGLFLIFCPILNIIFSIYLIIKHKI